MAVYNAKVRYTATGQQKNIKMIQSFFSHVSFFVIGKCPLLHPKRKASRILNPELTYIFLDLPPLLP